MRIGNHIKKFIGKKGYSDAEFARRIGCDPAYLTRLCNNENANPTAKTMFTIAKELGVSITDIWHEADGPTEEKGKKVKR